MHRLYTNFARFYEDGGTTGSAERDLDSARKIFEKATKVNFKAVEDLAEVWCEWAEMELRHEYAQACSHKIHYADKRVQELRRGCPCHAARLCGPA